MSFRQDFWLPLKKYKAKNRKGSFIMYIFHMVSIIRDTANYFWKWSAFIISWNGPRQNSKCGAGKRQTGRGHLWKIQKDGIFLTVVLRNLSGCLPAVKDGFMRRPCFAAMAAGRVWWRPLEPHCTTEATWNWCISFQSIFGRRERKNETWLSYDQKWK